ncbi:MAG: galactose-1-phosphate uridylyltransferase [Planctomycetes bacterium]|nr:galactose-1-phosphate uridylyltransferase [Planctomycetota bacterium]
MPELRRNPFTDEWTIISGYRGSMSRSFVTRSRAQADGGRCIFCEGSEALTPPEVDAIRPGGSTRDTPGWTVRAIPNKFPVLTVDKKLEKVPDGMFDLMSGVGAHEIIIESPAHVSDWTQLEPAALFRTLQLAQVRLSDLKKDFRLRCPMFFRSVPADETVTHSFSQLVCLPTIPGGMKKRLAAAKEHYLRKERCVYCDAIAEERRSKVRVVFEDELFVAISPYAAESAFALTLLPKDHIARFEHATHEHLKSLALALKKICELIDRALDFPVYTVSLQTAPFISSTGGVNVDDCFHFSFEIAPKVAKLVGFEHPFAQAFNPVTPEHAAEIYRSFLL